MISKSSVAQIYPPTEVHMTTQERKKMTTSNSQLPEDAICRMWDGKPLTTHGAFADIEEYQRRLSMGSNALKGIGAMLLPVSELADEETPAKRFELSEIFSFFGEVLAEDAKKISDAVFRIEQAAEGKLS